MKAWRCKPLGIHFNEGCVGGLEHGICTLKVTPENKWSQNPPAELCCDAKDIVIVPAAVHAAQQAAIAAAKTIIEQARATLKKAMLSGDIPTTPNTYTLVNADLDLRDALALIQKAKG